MMEITATVKMLTPGIFHMGACMLHDGKTRRGLSVSEARAIAENVLSIADISEQMAAIRADIHRVTRSDGLSA